MVPLFSHPEDMRGRVEKSLYHISDPRLLCFDTNISLMPDDLEQYVTHEIGQDSIHLHRIILILSRNEEFPVNQ